MSERLHDHRDQLARVSDREREGLPHPEGDVRRGAEAVIGFFRDGRFVRMVLYLGVEEGRREAGLEP